MGSERPFATLKRSRDFASLKEHGRRLRPSSWLLLSYLPNDLQAFRCGWTISKKVGNAVLRNRLKRWCRQYFREASVPYPLGLDINVILLTQPPEFYKNLQQKDFAKVLERGLKGVLKRTDSKPHAARDDLS